MGLWLVGLGSGLEGLELMLVYVLGLEISFGVNDTVVLVYRWRNILRFGLVVLNFKLC